MLKQSLTRRRMIVIAATAAGSAFLASARTAAAGDPVRWHGSALGAQVSIEIYHPDRAEAERLVERCVLDVRRLEQQFSLYRADSAISTLNRTGILLAPDADMVALLKASLWFAGITGGAFDPTGAAAVAAICGSFRFRAAGCRRALAAEARRSAGEGRPSWPACE